MTRLLPSIVYALLFVHIGVYAQNPVIEGNTTALQSQWKGFQRLDFQFEQKSAHIIFPNEALPGNPWIWRARFPDWHTDTDSILIAEGFHLVYINTNNQFGSPAAIKTWDKYYDFLISQYHLQKKVALMGVSRGGLFIYNWAKENPQKVACIYAEAPVCDFKSWPGGMGSGEGNADSWQILKAAYGFNSDQEAKTYNNNPIDNLEPLVNAKIPILHTIGLKDNIVPPEENTYRLVNKYIRLGGTATVVPCTEGPQALEGHHFPITSPRKIADYIKYNSIMHHDLASSRYHKYRGGLKNISDKFEKERFGRVAFLGGSITYHPGWRDSVCNYLKRKFPLTKFDFIQAGISSMGTTPAAFRLNRDVLSKGKIDLLFEEAAVNDATNERSAIEQVRGMEGIVRAIKTANPNTQIIIMHFVDPDKMSDYRHGKTPDVIRNHDKVAQHYGIPTINLAKEVTDRIDNGEFSWEKDFKDLHPSPFGQVVYANSMIEFLENAFDQEAAKESESNANELPKPLDGFNYEFGYLIKNTTAKLGSGWQIHSSWNPNDGTRTRGNYVDVPMLISTKPGSKLKLKFEGRAVGIAVAAGQDAGIIEFRVDKNAWKKVNLFTTWSRQVHLPWYYTLASELAEGEHLLEIRIAHEKDERSSGNACRIRYFFANR